MSANLKSTETSSSNEQAKSIDQENLKVKEVFNDVNELRDIINDLNQDLNSKHLDDKINKSDKKDLIKSDNELTGQNLNKESNMNSMNIIMNQAINKTVNKKNNKSIKEKSIKKEQTSVDKELNESIKESIESNDLEMFVQSSSINYGINQMNSISDQDNDNDFELISSDLEGNSNLDSNSSNLSLTNVNSNLTSSSNQLQSFSNTQLDSNLDPIIDSNQNSIENPHQFINKSNQTDRLSKSNSQNLSQTTKDLQNRSNKMKLFHHKSSDQVDQKKQTWQKQLLQTPFFKSFNTQQLLAHYGNHSHQQAPELPDKISNLDDEDNDEPLLSGSGQVSKECSDELIQLWSQILVKWKPKQRPAGLKDVIKYGIPHTMRGLSELIITFV